MVAACRPPIPPLACPFSFFLLGTGLARQLLKISLWRALALKKNFTTKLPCTHPSLGLSVFFLFLHRARDWRALALTHFRNKSNRPCVHFIYLLEEAEAQGWATASSTLVSLKSLREGGWPVRGFPANKKENRGSPALCVSGNFQRKQRVFGAPFWKLASFPESESWSGAKSEAKLRNQYPGGRRVISRSTRSPQNSQHFDDLA